MENVIVLHPRTPEERILQVARALSRAHRRTLALLLDDALIVAHADVVQLVAELEFALLVYPAGPSRWKLTEDGRAVLSVYFAQARIALGPQSLARDDAAARTLLEALGLRGHEPEPEPHREADEASSVARHAARVARLPVGDAEIPAMAMDARGGALRAILGS